MKRKIPAVALLLLLMLFSGGCGKTEEADIAGPAENSDKTTDYDSTEPFTIELHNVTDTENTLMVRPSGYVWTHLEEGDLATTGVADSADPLAENAPWDVLTLSYNGSDVQDYTISIPVIPDELMISAWNCGDIGRRSEECQTVESCVYSREEVAADDFSIPMQRGRVYEICMTWDKEKAGEKGFYGVVTYTFITDTFIVEGEAGASGFEKTKADDTAAAGA